MTLAYDIAGALPYLRSEAEARMTQTWRVGTLVETTDDDYNVIHVLDAVYDGPGRLKSVQATSVSEPEAGGQILAVQTLELHLPVWVAGVEVDMRAICDACPENPQMVGKTLRIKGQPTRGQVTAARFSVEESGEVITEDS